MDGNADGNTATRRSTARAASHFRPSQNTPASAGPRQPKGVPALIDDIGFGSAQWIPVILASAFFMGEGAELQIVQATTAVLAPTWGVSEGQAGLMVSIVMLGFMLGTLMSGVMSDMYGRRNVILIGYSGTAIFGAMPALANDYTTFTVLRFANGIACGVGVITSTAYISEINPSLTRQYMVALSMALFAAGEVFACAGIMYYMPNLVEADFWRELTVWGTLPAWLCLIPCILLLEESPVWLAGQEGGLEKAAEVLNRLAVKNGSPVRVSGDDIQKPQTAAGTADRLYTVLCNPRLRWITYPFCMLFLCANLIMVGMGVFYPVMFRENEMEFSPSGNLMVEAVAGLPSIGLTYIILWSSMGHKHSILMLGVIEAASCLIITAIWMREKPEDQAHGWQIALATIGCIVSKVVGPALFQICYVFVVESFPTPVRGTGVGVVASVGRLASVIAPIVLTALKAKTGEMTAFLLFISTATLIASLIALKIPRETKRQPLVDELPPEPRRMQRDTIAAAAAAPSGMVIGLLFFFTFSSGCCQFAYLMYAGQVMRNDAGMAEKALWIMLMSLQASYMLAALGNWVDGQLAEKIGWNKAVKVRLLTPLALQFAVMVAFGTVPAPPLYVVALLGVTLGAAGFMLYEIVGQLCVSIESANSSVAQFGYATGALVPLIVVGLADLAQPDWWDHTHKFYFLIPAFISLISLAMFAYSYPAQSEAVGEDEENALLTAGNEEGVRAQFKYAIRIFEYWGREKRAGVLPETDRPTAALMLFAAHAIFIVTTPFGATSSETTACILISLAIGDFLGVYIVTILENLIHSYVATLIIAGSLLVVRTLIMVFGWELMTPDSSTQLGTVGQFLWFAIFFSGGSSATTLRRGMEVYSKPANRQHVQGIADQYARTGVLIGLLTVGSLMFTMHGADIPAGVSVPAA